MSARGFNTKTPTIKRILKEAAELSTHPSPDFTASPLDANLFEWHFTLRGPPAPSPYANGIYHGRISLPPSYPLKPPNFRFLTPTGRFEVNREICLSISGHHEETWQPAWGIRTALVAIRSFMDSEVRGQVGGLECDRGVRERMARESRAWRCAGCGKSNGEILEEMEGVGGEGEAEGKSEEEVPRELRLAYREDLGGSSSAKVGEKAGGGEGASSSSSPSPSSQTSTSTSAPAPAPAPAPTRTVQTTPARTNQTRTTQPRPLHHPPDSVATWLDTAIYAVVAALLFMLLRKFAS